MTRRLFCSVTIIVAFACSTLVCAKPKDKDKDKENNSEVKFTSRTALVLVPTLVTDKSGNHIRGLKKEDFTVLENGAEQKVATFEEISMENSTSAVPTRVYGLCADKSEQANAIMGHREQHPHSPSDTV